MSEIKQLNSILIVDDNEADREWCKLVLRRSQRFRHILSSESGKDAFRLFQQYEESLKALGEDAFPPPIILLDINMHGMNGFEFLEALSALHLGPHQRALNSTSVFMLSSSENPGDRKKAMNFPNVRGFITKPMRNKEAHHLADQFGIK